MKIHWVKQQRTEGYTWELVVEHDHVRRSCATVWSNGTWHTWKQDGSGGANDVEESVAIAKKEATYAAVVQGFVS